IPARWRLNWTRARVGRADGTRCAPYGCWTGMQHRTNATRLAQMPLEGDCQRAGLGRSVTLLLSLEGVSDTRSCWLLEIASLARACPWLLTEPKHTCPELTGVQGDLVFLRVCNDLQRTCVRVSSCAQCKFLRIPRFALAVRGNLETK